MKKIPKSNLNVEFYVVASDGTMFAGLDASQRNGVKWTAKVAEAKPIFEKEKFAFFERYFSHMKCVLVEI